ncbi:MAG: adenylyl-sulfate kinase [Gammaproteobacteria bacterium]
MSHKKPVSPNVVMHESLVSYEDRISLSGHRSCLLWFTGLSGAGKSTLAHAVERRLFEMGVRTYVLDGDNVRHGLCGDLGFSEEDRHENIRRIGEVGNLFVDAGVVAFAAFISPFRADRQRVRDLMPDGLFVEVFCDTSLEVCEQRDVKGMYAKARRGEIKNYTGISSPYEAPENAEIVVPTGEKPLEECVQIVIDYLRDELSLWEGA